MTGHCPKCDAQRNLKRIPGPRPRYACIVCASAIATGDQGERDNDRVSTSAPRSKRHG